MPRRPIPLPAPRDGTVILLWSFRNVCGGTYRARWHNGAWRSLCGSKAFADDSRFIGWEIA